MQAPENIPEAENIDKEITPEEKAFKEHGFDFSVEVQARGLLEHVAPNLNESQLATLHELIKNIEDISLSKIMEIIPDENQALKIAKAIGNNLNRRIACTGFKEKWKYYWSESESLYRPMLVTESMKWLGAKLGKEDLRILYPASGDDVIGALKMIGRAPVAKVDCVTLGDRGAGAPTVKRANEQGVAAEVFVKDLGQAIEEDLKPNSYDCILMDLSGLGVLQMAAMGDMKGVEGYKGISDPRLEDKIVEKFSNLLTENGSGMFLKVTSMGGSNTQGFGASEVENFVKSLEASGFETIYNSDVGTLVQKKKVDVVEQKKAA